jgi:spermidine synthase
MVIFAATIFLSAFLLFLVQPMLAKFILPWFGGSAAVWTTCMIFFQSALLAGYGYAHFTTRRFDGKKRALLHIGLLILALATLPITPAAEWKPTGAEEPATRILLLLIATIGLPYLLLSSTSPLLQVWFAERFPGQSPYKLFALSNLASFLALIGYPFLVEPYLTAREQSWSWSAGFALFAVVCGALAWSTRHTPPLAESGSDANDADDARPTLARVGLWLTLSALGTVMLLGVSNHLTHNIPSIPLLWVMPLAIYLATFILAFADARWYPRRMVMIELVIAVTAMAFFLAYKDWQFKIYWHIGVFAFGLFVACLFCHGELVRAKPGPRHLTQFYLYVSLGGVIGGLLVGILAPLVLPGYFELEIALVALAMMAIWLNRRESFWLLAILVSTAAFASACLVYRVQKHMEGTIYVDRNFYGVLRVKEYEKDTETHHWSLVHGAILHGEQYRAEKYRQAATTYYKTTSGIGKTLAFYDGRDVKVGLIGLGAGTLATYADAGDIYRFYDINPAVLQVAESKFTFLKDAVSRGARVEAALGDARLQMEKELERGSQQFDVLAVDAFSGDSIPVHLITDEALKLYKKHMKTDGVIAFHVSNRFLELKPILLALAERNGLQAVYVHETSDGGTVSDWVLLTNNIALIESDAIKSAVLPIEAKPEWRIWTDDFNNIVQVLK